MAIGFPHGVLSKLWWALDWRSAAASRAGSTGLRQDVDASLLRRKFDGLLSEETRLPPSFLHPKLWQSAQEVRLLDITGVAEAVQKAPIVGLWRLAASQQKPSKQILEELSTQGALHVPKTEIVQRFLQLPMPKTKLLRLIQEFMGMCLVSKAEKEGRAHAAGLYRELPSNQKAFFSSINLTEFGVLVVRAVCENWKYIEALTAVPIPEMPEPKQEQPQEPPLVEVHCGGYPMPPHPAIPPQESTAFSAGILLTSRALRDYLLSLRVARLCKVRARKLFQAQVFGQALDVYRLGQWHCAHSDSTLFSNASLCCARLTKPHAAVEQAANALLLDDKNAKAAHALLKAEISLGHTDCNDWQLDVLEKLGHSYKTVAELLQEHRALPATDLSTLKAELGTDLHQIGLELVPAVEPRVFYLMANSEGLEEEDETGELRRWLLTAAVLGGVLDALLPAIELLKQPERLRSLKEIAASSLIINMEASLAIGQETEDDDLAFLYLATAAASQNAVVANDAGIALVDRILAKNHGKWKTGSEYGTWLMEFGGQGRRIVQLMHEALHIEREGDVVSFRPKA